MKRFFLFLLAVVMCISFCACSNNTGNDDAEEKKGKLENKKKVAELVLGEQNIVEDYIDFELFKIVTAKKLTASVAGDIYYENNNDGETYVDVILDLTNKSENALESEEVLTLTATNPVKTEYSDCIYAVETNNSTYLSQYEDIAPLSTVRMHCAVSVPESENELELELVINKRKYVYNYSLGNVVSDAKEIKVGDVIEEADFATLVFNGIEYTDNLLPSNTSGFYTHYEVDNTSNTYLAVKFDVTNFTSNEKECDTFAGVKAIYMDKYTYTGFLVVEDDDGKGFSSYESMAPLTTRKFYYLIEVPKTVVENDVSLSISFNGKDYFYAGR